MRKQTRFKWTIILLVCASLAWIHGLSRFNRVSGKLYHAAGLVRALGPELDEASRRYDLADLLAHYHVWRAERAIERLDPDGAAAHLAAAARLADTDAERVALPLAEGFVRSMARDDAGARAAFERARRAARGAGRDDLDRAAGRWLAVMAAPEAALAAAPQPRRKTTSAAPAAKTAAPADRLPVARYPRLPPLAAVVPEPQRATAPAPDPELGRLLARELRLMQDGRCGELNATMAEENRWRTAHGLPPDRTHWRCLAGGR